MPVISLIVVLVVIGVLMWLVNSYVPMSEPFKKILNVVVIIVTVWWLLSVFGVFTLSGTVGHLRY